MASMDIGNLHIDPVIDGLGRFKPTMTFRGTDEADWAPHKDLLDEDGLLPFTMGGFLVRGNARVTLVDLGLGRKRLMGIDGGAFLDNLTALGVAPDDVTDVIFTHLHIDHIGWAITDGRPTFANATYRASDADVGYFCRGSGADPGEIEILEPLAPHIKAWDEGSMGEIVPGIGQFAAPGHTPGSSVIVVSSDNERAMMLGDVVHCPVQLVADEWAGMFDVDPVLAKRTRNALAQELDGDVNAVMAGAHFPGMHFGRLIKGEGRRHWVVP